MSPRDCCNDIGRSASLSYPSGVVINFGYTAGKLTSITSGSETILSGVLYDPFGPIRGWTWGNASQTVRSFDLDGNVDLLDSGGLKTYAQDDAFRITGITDASDPNLSWNYGYDPLDRLTGAARAGLSQGWTYDANGNRLSQTGSAASSNSMSGTSNRLNGVNRSKFPGDSTVQRDRVVGAAPKLRPTRFHKPRARSYIGIARDAS